MNEPDIIGYAVGIFMTILFIGILLFVMFLPQIDRFVQKLRKKRSA